MGLKTVLHRLCNGIWHIEQYEVDKSASFTKIFLLLKIKSKKLKIKLKQKNNIKRKLKRNKN